MNMSIPSKYLTTAFCRSAKKRRTLEFRVRYVILTPFRRFLFDHRTVKQKQEVLKNPRRKQSGFSTLELMMAIVVLAIAVIGASLIPALSLGRSTDSKTYAANIAREVLDTYRGAWLNRTAFQSAAPLSTLPSGLRFGCTIASPVIEKLTLDSSYKLITTTGNPSMIRVVVTVTCNQNNVELSTLIGDPKPSGT
jgi:Tfp pilus assembly protein PilV